MSPLMPEQASETRSKITPYAFNVAPQLLDTPLARPWRRALAIFIDLILVAAAADLLSAFWAIPIFMLLWLIKQHTHGMLRRALFSLAFLLVVSASLIFEEMESLPSDRQLIGSEPRLQPIPDVRPVIRCQDSACIDKEVAKLQQMLNNQLFESATQYEIRKNILKNGALPPEEIARIFGSDPDESQPNLESRAQLFQRAANDENEGVQSNPGDSQELCEQKLSLLAMAQGGLKDLGFGFSWAIAYFTFLTCWFNGKTVGKRLLGIRVVRLDGKSLTLWCCLGRYGGYCAGIATGLLGFLQIFWDPNRQAIQDKISATAVTCLKRTSTG